MPAHCSGAMNDGVPSKVPTVVRRLDGVAIGFAASARAKARVESACAGAISMVSTALAALARDSRDGPVTLAIPKSSTFTLYPPRWFGSSQIFARLEVAVHDSRPMRRIQRQPRLVHDVQQEVERRPRILIQVV